MEGLEEAKIVIRGFFHILSLVNINKYVHVRIKYIFGAEQICLHGRICDLLLKTELCKKLEILGFHPIQEIMNITSNIQVTIAKLNELSGC